MPKIVDAEQYRKELLFKSAELFAERGYADLTTRELARELGVSTGTLYHYFPSKNVLFERLIDEICQQDVLRASEEIVKGQTIGERLKILGKYLAGREESCIKNLFLWIDYCQYQGRSELKESQIFERVEKRYHQAVIDILGIKDQAIAWLVLSFINGLMLERLWCNREIELESQMELLGKILTPYLEKSGNEY